jgi:hypothetical protein
VNLCVPVSITASSLCQYEPQLSFMGTDFRSFGQIMVSTKPLKIEPVRRFLYFLKSLLA